MKMRRMKLRVNHRQLLFLSREETSGNFQREGTLRVGRQERGPTRSARFCSCPRLFSFTLCGSVVFGFPLCFVLFCFLSFSSVLLHSVVLFSTVPFHSPLFFCVLVCSQSFSCSFLFCLALFCSVLFSSPLFFSALSLPSISFCVLFSFVLSCSEWFSLIVVLPPPICSPWFLLRFPLSFVHFCSLVFVFSVVLSSSNVCSVLFLFFFVFFILLYPLLCCLLFS